DVTDRLTGITGANPATYTWDTDGQLKSKTDTSGTTNYTFNVRGQLTGVALPDGSTIAYAYGPDGNIAQRTKTIGATTQTTNYLVDPNLAYAQVVAEYGTDGHATAIYVYGDELLMRITPSGTTDYHHDGLGSVIALTDDTGTAIQTYGYDAWGNLVESTGTDANPYKFAGERFDADTNLIYLRARWYDAQVGRFVAGDKYSGKEQMPLSLNKYLYANTDPINGRDPSGLFELVGEMETLQIGGILSNIATATVGTAIGITVGGRINNIVRSRAAAKACAASYASGLRPYTSGDCSQVRMPIVFMSETLMPGIGEHVQKSQALGSPAVLNRTSLLKITNRALNIAKCKIGLGISVANGGSSCDEYPFASTYQGGIGATVAKVPLYSNLVQGGVLSSFYYACFVPPDVFPVNEFLVIPVLSTPTNFECRFFGPR
ncbi:MAG: RHS repeat-associated core domain-containing protein, partial [Rudaea sp.]